MGDVTLSEDERAEVRALVCQRNLDARVGDIEAAVERIAAERARALTERDHDECAALMEQAASRIEAVLALCEDPWHGDARWEAVHHTGVSRRGALRGGDFVAVEDIRAALAPAEQGGER